MEMKFSDLEFKADKFEESIRAKHEFDNGYGVSVLRFNVTLLEQCGDTYHKAERGSYGSGLYEVAVTKGGKLCYDTLIADGVIGDCDEEEVEDIMEQVSKL